MPDTTNSKDKDVVQEIRAVFYGMGCPALVILQTDRAGEEVENGMGVEFDLALYAVIHKNSFFCDEANTSIYYDWLRTKSFNVMHFAEKNCKSSVETLCEELRERDGYNIIWKRDTETK